MRQRLPKQLLRKLRNRIPVSFVITDILELPHKFYQEQLVFLCPICREFRTSIHKPTNLARCFLCQKNFNPIDIVISAQSCSFIQAVDLLSPFLNSQP